MNFKLICIGSDTCPDGSSLTSDQYKSGLNCDTKPKNCGNGVSVSSNQACPEPPVNCGNGVTVPAGQTCPIVPPKCSDGSLQPPSGICPQTCTVGKVIVPVNADGSCPTTCPDGSMPDSFDQCCVRLAIKILTIFLCFMLIKNFMKFLRLAHII